MPPYSRVVVRRLRRAALATVAVCLVPVCRPAGAEEPPAPPLALSFADFLEPGPRLAPSAKLLEASGHRVRLTGFMAAVDAPLAGAFYLCPRPTVLDEEGAGTADLPPETVRVIVPRSVSPIVRFRPGRLEVTGLLEVGYREEEDGGASWIRLTADAPLGAKEK
jgi:hypothetical protein